jgi:hypothetical protein
LKAKVLGVDLTADPSQATVRIGLDVLSTAVQSGQQTWTINDPWVWRGDNWYLNLEDPANIIPKGELLPPVNLKDFQTQIEKNFEIVTNPVDLGKLTAGQHLQVELPIKYTGDLPLSIERAVPNPLVDVAIADGITSKSKNLVLLVNTEGWEGPFTLPLSLRIKHRGVSVDRMVMVKGEVFAPLVFRQSPPNGPIEEGQEFSVFIRNNTDQKVGVTFFSTDGKLAVVKQPAALPPKEEAELVLKLRPGQLPDMLYVNLDSALSGHEVYTYRFRNVRP